MERLTKYSNDLIRNKAVNILRKLDSENGLDGDELAPISSFCLIERVENKQLKKYEDLEEQGKLLKLPVAVGDAVWKIKNGEISKWVVSTIKIEESGVSFCNAFYICDLNDFGKTVFLTKEAAEAALKEMSE